jgi:hypothetical protein
MTSVERLTLHSQQTQKISNWRVKNGRIGKLFQLMLLSAHFIPIEPENEQKQKRGAEEPRLAWLHPSESISSPPLPAYRAGAS